MLQDMSSQVKPLSQNKSHQTWWKAMIGQRNCHRKVYWDKKSYIVKHDKCKNNQIENYTEGETFCKIACFLITCIVSLKAFLVTSQKGYDLHITY